MGVNIGKLGRLIPVLLLSGLLGACVSPPPTLYQWEGYQSQVYSYLRGDPKNSLDKQITEMEKGLQKIQAKGHTPPPGYYAHLGMLYGETGQSGLMQKYLQEEKQYFPESAPFIDYLLSKSKK